MIQLTAQTRILVAIEPADFRSGIDGLARLAREVLDRDPFTGCLFVFRNRSCTAIKVLAYDGQGFWLCHKRLSDGKFSHWPRRGGVAATSLEAHELTVLLRGGDPAAAQAAPVWRAVPGAALGTMERASAGGRRASLSGDFRIWPCVPTRSRLRLRPWRHS